MFEYWSILGRIDKENRYLRLDQSLTRQIRLLSMKFLLLVLVLYFLENTSSFSRSKVHVGTLHSNANRGMLNGLTARSKFPYQNGISSCRLESNSFAMEVDEVQACVREGIFGYSFEREETMATLQE